MWAVFVHLASRSKIAAREGIYKLLKSQANVKGAYRNRCNEIKKGIASEGYALKCVAVPFS